MNSLNQPTRELEYAVAGFLAKMIVRQEIETSPFTPADNQELGRLIKDYCLLWGKKPLRRAALTALFLELEEWVGQGGPADDIDKREEGQGLSVCGKVVFEHLTHKVFSAASFGQSVRGLRAILATQETKAQ